MFLFYVATNFGFLSQYQSQVNKELWIDALLQLSSSQKNNLPSPKTEPSYDLSEISVEDNPIDFAVFPDDTSKVTDKLEEKINLSDTSKIIADSLSSLVDTVKVDSAALDSTARMKYFRYQREDKPYVELKRKKPSKFFAYPDQRFVTRSIQIDSTGQFVEVVEKIAGQQTKIILKMTIDDYIQMRLGLREREIWESIGYAYELKDTKKELGELIKDITNLEIPLPSVGVLSIFGEPKISLRIGGAVDIHGAWRNETTEGVTASRLGNTRNEPDFKQQVQINVSGTIGDKLNIVADWNTERTFEYENQLKIKYTGYEDEIVQSVEAGNVSLQASPLVGGSEALFGIKASFKVGPLSLTTIASQKKGEVKEVSVSGGSTSQTFEKRAYDYSTNHYFVDTIYASQNPDLNLFQKYYDNATPQIESQFLIKDIEVWKSIQTIGKDPAKERLANAFINLPELAAGIRYDSTKRSDIINEVKGQIEQSRFRLLTKGEDYLLNEYTGFLTFNTQINDNDILAVAYRVEKGPGAEDDSFLGEFVSTAQTDSQRLVLKMIKPAFLQPGGNFAQAWKLQLKNIYPVGGRNIKKEGFEFQVKYEVSGQDPVVELPGGQGNVRLLNAFGFDNYDAADQANPDNIFDWRTNLTIIPQTGEIIFPVLEPFGRNIPNSEPKKLLNADSLKFQAVYDTTKTFAQQQKVKDKWILSGKYSGEASSVYQLGFNIVENSVRVRLSGRELNPGIDYIVDYNIGQLTIRNDAALVPGADLKITYEQNDLFQLASKTLLGARGIFDFSQKTKLGFSVLNLNQQTLSDKVRIGEEPLSNTIYGLDFNTGGDLPFLTKLLDKVISTKQMSSFTLQGEFAYIDPDPNTKKSTIVSDQGSSIAYIDDFEGAKRIIPVGVSYTAWKDLSPPRELPTLPNSSDQTLMNYKAKSFWYTETPSFVRVQDIWGSRKRVAKQEDNVTVMDYIFLPDTQGTYNYTPSLQDRNKNWGGIMKLLSSTASNLVEENVEFIEFWLKIENAPKNSKVYIDIGRISEDVIPNRKLDTEDKDGNDAIDVDGKEDTGIDGMTDDQERASFNSTAADPSGDNFSFSQTIKDYYNINGTQGNAILSDIGRLPDTEDLNRNGNINLINSFFRYEIPLDTNAQTNKFIAGGGDNDSWYLYRIPLKDTLTKIGEPSFTTVEALRFFITGVDQSVHLKFAEFNLVGSQWQKLLPQDTILSVSVISYEDNRNYEIPPGVNQERDRTKPDEQVFRNEQSLNLILQNLPDGESREAVRYLYRPLDVFNYKEMKLFIHGDNNYGPASVSSLDENYNAEVYFRFGTDSNNYYEYRQPVRPGWNEIRIIFSELTSIKQARDSVNQRVKIPVPGLPGHFYLVKGTPTLTQVKFLTAGIFNTTNPNSIGSISGEVWVNELRVIGAEDTPGWAYSMSASIKMADLLSVNFNMSHTDPYFHRLADRFGSRVETRNWAASADLDVLKLLPINLPESNLKLNYSHSESTGKPLYLPGTDVKVDEAAQQLRDIRNDSVKTTIKTPEQLISESQTVNVSDSWSLSNIKLKIPTQLWFIRDSFNSITMGFNYNKMFSSSPTVLSNKSWIWNANLSYGLNLSPDYFFYPANIPVIGSILSLLVDYRNAKVYFTPQSFSLNLTAKRNRNVNISRPQNNIDAKEIISRDFTTSRGFNLSWKITEGGLLNLSTNYNVNMSSSLAFLEIDQFGRQRSEGEIWGEIFSGKFFGKDYQYQQSVDFRTSPRLPSLWDINKFFTVSTGYSASYQWSNDFRQEVLGRGAGFASKVNATLTLKLKSLMQPLFQEAPEEKVTPPPQPPTQTNRTRGRDRVVGEETKNEQTPADSNKIIADSLQTVLSDSSMVGDSLIGGTPKKSVLTNALKFLKTFARIVLFDYETINFTFSSDNNVSKSGIAGKGTGFYNFWGILFKPDNGPSRGFMLGLSDVVGPRAANGNLQDVFSQRNSFDFKTSRPLWEGAKIDLNWKVGWSTSKSTNLQSDATGRTTITNITSSGTIDRSFLSFPPSLFLSVFKSGIKQVNELYDPDSPNPRENLSAAFVKGFESFPIFAKLGFLKDFVKYVPRPNWRISWDGLETFFLFKSFAKKVSLTHEYKSGYTEGWKLTPDGNKEILTQRIDYAFAPLAGFNFTFGDLWGGSLISSLKYSTRTSYDLGNSTRNITETFSKDIGITAGYSKSGFELPLFGISLKNDIEFSFSYNSTKNSTVIYDMTDFIEDGTPRDGTIRTTLEPRIKYTISSKVTLSIFYRRSSVEPEGAARIPPTTTNEAGLDVHISIQ